ncbi:uncharacterized protein EDB91DRAFT_1171427 [Suillus paluster]|uniref:uncharacterized protein n=1 Tax=Suillus paluster TaxID=48578 RepID=UPI001B85C353|nr:uncharacterized protein EDB91DRAFT_1171427 [Suillus paluster]KAG1724083.1 hypothetical protein EDB91DRAFT_1171427 [Suillus paluster]
MRLESSQQLGGRPADEDATRRRTWRFNCDTDEDRAGVRFVTEGEASLHACVQRGLAADVLSVCIPTYQDISHT